MIWHFIDGAVIFALIYAYLLYPVLPGSPWLRGTIWGLILWFLSQALVMMMLGQGFFSARAPEQMKAVTGTLIAHLVYEAILGVLAGRQAERLPHPRPARPA